MMSDNRWSPEQRAAAAVAIRAWAPWTRSSGPKSVEGKARVAMNSLKHGKRSERQRALSMALTAMLVEADDEVFDATLEVDDE
jgi:hypothetical protein